MRANIMRTFARAYCTQEDSFTKMLTIYICNLKSMSGPANYLVFLGRAAMFILHIRQHEGRTLGNLLDICSALHRH